jgi:Xaa-Pro aminopeptidase
MNSTEIKCITKACSITVNILKQLIKELKKHSFKTELDIANYLKQKAKENNCKLAFPPLVVTGKNAAEIHHKPDSTPIKKGFLIIDFGVKYKGYCSDITRTFYIGRPTKKEISLYNLVLEAQLTALNHVQPGVHAADIDLIARAALWKYYKNFVHGTGHGIGKKIHQAPNLKPKGRRILKKNQAITVEPGLYFKNKLGIRIEDTVLVDSPAKVLTKLTKKLITI